MFLPWTEITKLSLVSFVVGFSSGMLVTWLAVKHLVDRIRKENQE